jgi:adenylate kinase
MGSDLLLINGLAILISMKDTEQLNTIKNWIKTGSINIFGLPFSGKDTQGRRLTEIFDGNLIGAGKIFRGDNMPDRVKECMRNGKLVPTNDFVDIVLPYLSQPDLAGKPLILSSIGRWHGEEEGVVKATELSGHPMKAVLYLSLSGDEVYDRWQALEINKDLPKRIDDSKEILATRLAEFQEKTLPVLDYYRDLGLLIEVDGRRTRDEVTHDILDALGDWC